MPYKCSKCNSDITEEQTAKTVDKFEKALCNKCILDGVEESAPSAPPEEPAQQTHNVGDGAGNDVPVLSAVDDFVNAAKEANSIVPHAEHAIEPQSTPIDMVTIKKYICPTATDKEAFAFMQLCKARNLNPFTKEAYLLKYGNGAATMVVGKDAFTRRAEDNLQFDGFEAGIIVKMPDIVEEREGTFIMENEKLLGGWAKVYRKDHTYPVTARVSMKEYDTGKSSWAKMPATMIRKVALVQALRESFPSDLGGCYDSSEMGAEI